MAYTGNPSQDRWDNPERTAHQLRPIFTGGVKGTPAASDTRYGADQCTECDAIFMWCGDWHFFGMGTLTSESARIR